MKRIPLRVESDPQLGNLAWGEVIRQVVRRPLDPQKGADIEEMRRGIRILDALDAADEVLELEDADWEHLKQKTLAMPWGMVDKRLIQFHDDVTMATDQVPLNFLSGSNGVVSGSR